MGVSLEAYRAAIGISNVIKTTICRGYICYVFALVTTAILFILMSSFCLLILLSGSVHPNPGPRKVNMSLAHLNVGSLNISDKLNEIAAIVGVHDFDVLAFTDTWLNPKISNDTLMLSGYHPPTRRDRPHMCGGGVALYVAEHLLYTRRLDLESDDL